MVEPYYQDDLATLYLGDCLEVLPEVKGVGCVVTSPPYAQQRAGLYDGIDEALYPEWFKGWMGAMDLAPNASVFVNIREHIANGEMSDYVHRSRMALREAGWIECDELIWVKPSSPPVGHPRRPRRSWERILWFSLDRQPVVNPKAAGQQSDQIGFGLTQGSAAAMWAGNNAIGKPYVSGVSRTPDFVSVGTGGSEANRFMPNGGKHPAMFPSKLAEWMIMLGNGLVLDPFAGSGTTLLAASGLGRKSVGVEISEEYCEIAAYRLAAQAAEVEQQGLDFGDV